MTFLEFLQEDSKSQEAIDIMRKKEKKLKRVTKVKLKHTDKKQSEAGTAYWHHNRTPEMLKRQSGL